MFSVLNVRLARAASEHLASDTDTTTARILRAALARFPVDGFEGTTVRALADDADVSPALIVHHYGSKEGLRRACDDHVIEQIRTVKGDAISTRRMTDAGFIAGSMQIAPLLIRYLGWALATGSQAAADLFDEMLEESIRLFEMAEEQGYVRPSDHPRARSAVMLSMQLGSLVLHDHLERSLGVDPLEAEGLMQLAQVSMEIFSGSLFPPEVASQMQEAVAEAAATIRKEEGHG